MYQKETPVGLFTVYEKIDFPIGTKVRVVDIGSKPDHPRYLEGSIGIVVFGTSKQKVKVFFETFDNECFNIYPQFLRKVE